MKEGNRSRRDSIIAKVRALHAKTVENGCTEAEAMQAAEAAARLMAKYDLEMDDVDVREDGVSQQEQVLDPVLHAHMKRVAMAISSLCGVRTWGDGRRPDRQVFFGLPHDVEIAGYLFAICERALSSETAKAEQQWMLYTPMRKAKLRNSFLAGMTDRLCEKLRELAWARHKATGNALVPLKDAIIDAAMKNNGIKLETGQVRGRRMLDAEAFRMGRGAGDRVRLDPAIGTEEAEDLARVGAQ